MRRLASILLLIVLASARAVAATPGQPDPIAAVVLDLSGNWCVSSQTGCQGPLEKGQLLDAGARLVAQQATRAEQMLWFVGLVLRDGRYFGQSCAQAGSCATPLEVPAARAPPSPAVQRIWAAVRDVFAPRAEAYFSVAMSRGGGSCRVKEGIVRSTDEGLDLDGVLEGTRTACALELTEIGRDGSPLPRRAAMRIGMRNGRTHVVVPPGLYKLEAEEPGVYGREFAWVRVTGPRSSPALAREFAEMRTSVEAWTDAEPAARSSVLKAFLASQDDRP